MDSQGLMPKPPVLDTHASYQGWTDVVKSHLSQFDPRTVDAALCGIGGFVVGYLLKNFGRLLLMGLVVGGLALLVLHMTQVYTVDMAAIKSLFGVSKTATISDLVTVKIAWITANPIAAVAGIAGLLVGWKVG